MKATINIACFKSFPSSISRSKFLRPGSAVAGKKVNIDADLIKMGDDGSLTVLSETKADVSYSVD